MVVLVPTDDSSCFLCLIHLPTNERFPLFLLLTRGCDGHDGIG